jgi:RNA 2',3'-cyclic 3'-phosphodiesterase
MDMQATADSTQFMRLFFALWPDDATREALQRLQTNIAGRRTAYGNLHITLAFLGRQPAGKLPALLSILDSLSGIAMPLAIDRFGYFARNRVAWAGMHQVPQALLQLRGGLVQALLDNGIEFDNRGAFKPHITLARDAKAPADIVFEPIHWHAGHVALVRSSTHAAGVSYSVIGSRWLEQAA